MQTINNSAFNDEVPIELSIFNHFLSSSEFENTVCAFVYDMPLKQGIRYDNDSFFFDKQNGNYSSLSLELGPENDLIDLLILARVFMEKNMLHLFFVFDSRSRTWYNVQKTSLGFSISTNYVFK